MKTANWPFPMGHGPDFQPTMIGVNMSKKEYLALILSLLRPDEIKLSAANPTQYMTKTHVLLHYVALRRLGVNP
jgi:hypothetical protein